MKKVRTGITFHPKRRQPYTVWFREQIVWFAYSEDEAEAKLAKAQEDAKANAPGKR